MGNIELITRFNLFSEGVVGRAYVFSHKFGKSYGNVDSAIRHMKEVAESPGFQGVRDRRFGLVNAIMWGGDGEDNAKMIDFFGIGANDYFRRETWPGNPDIHSWVTRNGIIVPKKPISEVTCGNGWHIIDAEEQYRRTRQQDGSYWAFPPVIEGVTYLEGDLCIDSRPKQ